MYLSKTKTPKGKTYLCIAKSFYVDGKSKTRTIKKIGYLEDLQKEMDDPIAYYTELAKQMTRQEKEFNLLDTLPYDPKGEAARVDPPITNLAVPVLLQIYEQLEIDPIFRKLEKEYDLDYSLADLCKYVIIKCFVFGGHYTNDLEPKELFFTELDFKGIDDFREGISILNDNRKRIYDEFKSKIIGDDFAGFDNKYKNFFKNFYSPLKDYNPILRYYTEIQPTPVESLVGHALLHYFSYFLIWYMMDQMDGRYSDRDIVYSLANLNCYQLSQDLWHCDFANVCSREIFHRLGLTPAKKYMGTEDIKKLYPKNSKFKKEFADVHNLEFVYSAEDKNSFPIRKNEAIKIGSKNCINLGQALPIQFMQKIKFHHIVAALGNKEHFDFMPYAAVRYLLFTQSVQHGDLPLNMYSRRNCPYNTKFNYQDLVELWDSLSPFEKITLKHLKKYFGEEKYDDFMAKYEEIFRPHYEYYIQRVVYYLDMFFGSVTIEQGKTFHGLLLFDLIAKAFFYDIKDDLCLDFTEENYSKVMLELRKVNCCLLDKKLWYTCYSSDISKKAFKAYGFKHPKQVLKTREMKNYFSVQK